MKHSVTYGSHFPSSLSLSMKSPPHGINKTRTAEQSIAVLPHGIMHFNSSVALDWSSRVFFSLLSSERYRPLRNSPSQEQKSLSMQKGRKVAETARQPPTWKYKKVFIKTLNKISSVQAVVCD